MKLTKTEKYAMVLALLFVALAIGVRMGARQAHDSFTITTQNQAVHISATETTPELATETTPEKTQKTSGTVNINTAEKEELMTLEGIGEKLAERIIDYRQENGNFDSIEDITRVYGIGSGIFEKISGQITVSEG